MTEDDLMFLHTAKLKVSKNPALFGHIITVCTQGIEGRVSLEQERAADFETIAAAYMAITGEKRKTPTMTKWANDLIKAKMLKWEDKTCCNFSAEIKEIKEAE